MKISIITLFPQMIEAFFKESIIKRAQEKGLVKINLIDLRRFAIDKHGTVDDRPYGGGAGMVLRVDVVYKALSQITKNQLPITKQISIPKSQFPKQKILLTSPKGKRFNQQMASNYSKLDHLLIIAGHYEGVDQRVRGFIDEEISLGDFILTGGEIAAAAIVDATVRLVPGVLKKPEAKDEESFFTVSINRLIKAIGGDKRLNDLKKKGVKRVKLLEYPHYTRPADFKGKTVPPVLLSGDHQKIENWRLEKAYKETVKKRPDLLMS